MSTNRVLFSAYFAAVIFATSCANYEESPLNPEPQAADVTIDASLEVPQDATRTALTDEDKVVWSKDDAFALLSGTTKDRFDLISGAGTADASFSGTVTGSAPFYALYPYSENCTIENGSLKFTLPQEQNYVDGTFDSGASPAIATLQSVNDAAKFKNLCGVLQINLCGSSSQKVKGLEIINLDGTPLWGDCTLALDGKQGTDGQTMTVTGGSNVLKVNFSKEENLKASTPKVVDVVVPAGSFAKGFSVRIYDATGAVISFLTAQNDKVKTVRSFITAMDKLKIPANGEPLDVHRRGYYKDVFMDGGCHLTSRTTLPACPYLGWTLDYLATEDSLFQRKVMVVSDDDANGAILYPDSEPRYRMIYVNGGKANSHGKSLTETGRNRIQNFVTKGGSYVGSCAGAFIAHSETTTYKYLGLIPASMTSSGLSDSYTGMDIPKDSPLLKYGYDFGGDFYVDSVRHNGGGYMKPANLPVNGEILATFVKPGWKMDGNGSIWSYKGSNARGRVLVTGSHPEGVTSGERLDLMAAMMLYSTEGAGDVTAKVSLINGTTKNYNRSTGVNAGVGDKQYHHFKVEIPEGAKNIRLYLDGDSDLDLHLSIRKGDFAWRSDADYLLTQAGCVKSMEWDTLEPGTWYVSVYCPAEITTTCGTTKFSQTGDIEALNGVPYSIQIVWE